MAQPDATTPPMSKSEALLQVTQADRDAAAPILRLYGAENYALICEKGLPYCDQLAMLQAFARHRIAALRTSVEASPSDGVVENEPFDDGSLIGDLRRVAKGCHDEGMDEDADTIARAIAALRRSPMPVTDAEGVERAARLCEDQANRLAATPDDHPDKEKRDYAIGALMAAAANIRDYATTKADAAGEGVDVTTKLADQAYGRGYEEFRNKWIGDHEEMCADLVRWFVPRTSQANDAAGEGVAMLSSVTIRSRDAGADAMRAMDEWDTYEHKDDLVLLLVEFEDHPTEDATFALTIGGNNDHNVMPGEGQGWQFAGWCWTHDHWTEGKGIPVGWMPLPHHWAREREADALNQSPGHASEQTGDLDSSGGEG